MGSSVGMKNNIYAVLVMGVCEVLVEYNFLKANYRLTSSSFCTVRMSCWNTCW